MSSFTPKTSAAPSSGGTSLFPALNLATTPTLDASGRKRSIFEPSTSQNPSPLANMFSNTGSSTSASGASITATTTTASTPLNFLAATSAPSFSFSTATSSAPNTFGGGNPATSSAPKFNFGATTTSSAPPSNNIFASGVSTSQPATGFSGFGMNTNQQAPAGTSTCGNGGQSTTQPDQSGAQQEQILRQQTSDPAHFRSLLERQKRKARFAPTEQNGGFAQLPSLNMDLGDLARKAQEIGGRASQTSSRTGNDSRAHYLLAGSGVSPGKAYKDLQTLEGEDGEEHRPSLEPLEPSTGRYIRDLQQKGREAMMKESMAKVYREVDNFIQDSLGIDFEEHKQRIMEHFGLISKGEDGGGNAPQDSPGPKGTFGRSAGKRKGGFADSGRTSTRSVFGRSALEKSMIGAPGPSGSTTSFFGEDASGSAPTALSRGQTARDLRDKERLYIERVEKLNLNRLEGKPFPILLQFAGVEANAGGDGPRQLVDAYHALREITKENAELGDSSAESPIKERQYASTYQDNESNSQQGTKLKKQIIDGSRTHLEKTFYRELESLVEKNPREAQLGGRPTVANKVRAYIRVRSARRDLAPDGVELQRIGDEGDYCWILIFYLLRSGYPREAIDYVENDPAFQSTDKRFISYLKSYCNSSERRLNRKLQDMINGEYAQRSKIAVQHTVDPYRMACYKIIGRCDLSSRNLDIVGQGVEDWVWLQFSLAREHDRTEELPGDTFGLEQIRETITEIGQKHFQKGQAESSGGYGTYFLMQILGGMFEQAVEYLHSCNPVSAVHFAIALSYYGFLRVSDHSVAGNDLLTYSTTQQPQINFVPLIAYYTAAFRTALPVAAVDYLSLICINSDLTPAALGAAQTVACHECLRQLCLETREFARLLGDIRSDGTRIAGVIEQKGALIKLQTHEDFLHAVTIQAAVIANERGQVADAVLLYHLSEDYDNVIGILNRALADAVALDLGDSPMQLQPLKPRSRSDQSSSTGPNNTSANGPQSSLSLTQSTSSPVELAKNMISLYNENAAYYNLISATNRDTCGALLQLLSARASLESNPPDFMAALETLNDLNILPLRANGSIPAIRAAASAFGSLPQLLARCAGLSVVWAVRAIGGERDNLIKHGSWDAGSGGDRDAIKDQLNSMAKDLMVFAGLVKYKLPGRVYDMLTRAGGDVGIY